MDEAEHQLPRVASGTDEALDVGAAHELHGLERADLSVDSAHVFRCLGIHPDRPNHARWVRLFHDLESTLPRIYRPRAVVRVDRVTRLGATELELESGASYAGAIGRFLRDSRYVATFVLTLGRGPERLARRWLNRSRLMHGTMVDTIASEATERLADHVEAHLARWAAARGLGLTPRYSPGYCGLSLAQQSCLFDSVSEAAGFVKLTANCLMLPMKSISGLIGVVPGELAPGKRYPCERCGHPDCTQRRAPRDTRCAADVDGSSAGVDVGS